MKFEKAIELTQKALAQSMGTEYANQQGNLADLPVEKLVDIGKDVSNSDVTTEKYTKALISVISYYELMQPSVNEEFLDLFVKSELWGGFVERIYYNVAQVMSDPMWNVTNGTSYSDIEHTFYQPSVSAKIFNEAKAGMIPISIQRDTLMESFRGWDELNAYVSGIHTMIKNTLKMIKKVYGRMAVSAGIAESNYANGMNTAVHLLTEAVARGVVQAGTTAEQALEQADFLAFAAKRISEVRDYMKVESTAYNNHTVLTSADVVKLYILKDFERSLRFNLRADTYNPEDRSLGDYTSITAWQGIANDNGRFGFDTLSTVKLAADPDGKLGIGTEAIEISGVIGFAFDYRALGCTLNKIKVTSSYTSCADFWNEFTHFLMNWIVDTNLNMVAFIVD